MHVARFQGRPEETDSSCGCFESHIADALSLSSSTYANLYCSVELVGPVRETLSCRRQAGDKLDSLVDVPQHMVVKCLCTADRAPTDAQVLACVQTSLSTQY